MNLSDPLHIIICDVGEVKEKSLAVGLDWSELTNSWADTQVCRDKIKKLAYSIENSFTRRAAYKIYSKSIYIFIIYGDYIQYRASFKETVKQVHHYCLL